MGHVHLQSLRCISARLPIRWRLALVSFGLLAILLSALGIFVSITEEQALFDNQAVALHNEAQLAINSDKGGKLSLTASPAVPAAQPKPAPALATSATTLVQRLAGTSIRAEVLLADGTILASSNTVLLVPQEVSLPDSDIQQALSGQLQQTSYILANDVSGQRQLVVLLPLYYGQSAVAVLQLNTPTASIDSTITTTRVILVLGILGTLIIAGALTLPLVGVALRPLSEMERASRRIADGALSLRLQVPATHDEFERLSRSFNHMIARLQETIERQKQFVADVSHELRTPLTAVGGSLEMLMLGADSGDRETRRRLLHSSYAEVARMQRLVEDLLMLTRIDEGRIQLREEVIAPGTLLHDVCEEARHVAKGRYIECSVDPDISDIRADSDRLRQVLLNIIDNACKFTALGGMVKVTARQEGAAHVIITVQDSGIGIVPEALPHVFDRFYRADPARTRSHEQIGGSGLGLAIAKGLIEAQRGSIDINSTPGVGTTVTIELPSYTHKKE
jgi:two-component system OmpR family sensor kinase